MKILNLYFYRTLISLQWKLSISTHQQSHFARLPVVLVALSLSIAMHSAFAVFSEDDHVVPCGELVAPNLSVASHDLQVLAQLLLDHWVGKHPVHSHLVKHGVQNLLGGQEILIYHEVGEDEHSHESQLLDPNLTQLLIPLFRSVQGLLRQLIWRFVGVPHNLFAFR
jgi:hypothetical protein